MDTIIKDTLSQHKIMLDQNCKLMISHEEMLSRIIKEFVEEAKHLSIEEIIKIVQDEHRFQRLNNDSIPIEHPSKRREAIVWSSSFICILKFIFNHDILLAINDGSFSFILFSFNN